MEEPTERKTKFRVMIRWSNDEQRMVWHKDIDVLLPLGTLISPFCDDAVWIDDVEFLGNLEVSGHEMVIRENLLIIKATDSIVGFSEGIHRPPNWFKEAMQAAGWNHNTNHYHLHPLDLPQL